MIQPTIILRNLWRNNVFTLLNIVGLAVGMTAAWVMWHYTDFEFGFDKQIPNSDRVFRVISKFKNAQGEEFHNSGCPEPLWRAAQEVAGLRFAVPVHAAFCMAVTPEGSRSPFKDVRQIAHTTPRYFEILPSKWLAGSPAAALTQPDQVVLARSRAEKYFPRHQPQEVLGKTLHYEFSDDTVVATVVGVVEDLDFPSSFFEKELLTAATPREDRWGSVNSNQQTWVLLHDASSARSVAEAISAISGARSADYAQRWNMTRWHELQPLLQVHTGDIGSHLPYANANTLKTLSMIALFLLLLACINYINMSTAQIPGRAREIGIRKTIGGRSWDITGAFLAETAAVVLLAALLAGLLTYTCFDYFQEELPKEVLKYADWRKTALFLLGLFLVVVLLSGLYPAWLASRYQPVALLRARGSGVLGGGRKLNVGLRRGLIVFQFFVAQVFIIGAFVVGRQLHFMRTADLGFDKEAVITFEQPRSAWRDPAQSGKMAVLANSLRQHPEIERVVLGDNPLSNSYSSNEYTYTDPAGNKREVNLYRKQGEAGLMDFYKIPLLAGRALREDDPDNHLVINETAMRAYGFGSHEAAIGKIIAEKMGPGEPDKSFHIVGVASDFHTMGFSQEIHPAMFMLEKEEASTINVKPAGDSPAGWKSALQKIEAEWSKIYPGEEFSGKFYDETLEEIYEADMRLGYFINFATLVAIFISCLGLFGLSTFMAWRRTKEIGIRKVLGASVSRLVGLLSREFMLLVLLGFLPAVPVALYLLRRWLQEYAYRIELQWWMFAAAAAVALFIAFLTVSVQSMRAALSDPVKSLRSE